jgi:hypothetical protein
MISLRRPVSRRVNRTGGSDDPKYPGGADMLCPTDIRRCVPKGDIPSNLRRQSLEECFASA